MKKIQEADKLLITVLTHKGRSIVTTEYFAEKSAADELEQGCKCFFYQSSVNW